MQKELLFLPRVEGGIDLYPYFEAVLFPDRCPVKLKAPAFHPDTLYYLPLPFPIVSPRVWQKPSRLAMALGMDEAIFADLCSGSRVILNKEAQKTFLDNGGSTEGGVFYRDDLILRPAAFEGLSTTAAFLYLCEHYLEGLSLREDCIVSAIRVDRATVEALSMDEEAFLKNEIREAYARVFSRIVRVMRLHVLSAPRIVMRNEIWLLNKTIASLAEIASFPME